MEIYLNIAEWGPDGEFGVEAGARRPSTSRPRELSRGRGGAARRGAAESEAAQRQGAAAGVRRIAGIVQARAARAGA